MSLMVLVRSDSREDIQTELIRERRMEAQRRAFRKVRRQQMEESQRREELSRRPYASTAGVGSQAPESIERILRSARQES